MFDLLHLFVIKILKFVLVHNVNVIQIPVTSLTVYYLVNSNTPIIGIVAVISLSRLITIGINEVLIWIAKQLS